MIFKPNHSFNLIKDCEYESQILSIEQELNQYAVKGSISSFDDLRLNYEMFFAENAHATIIIVHGLSEFYKKYYEMTCYYLNMGYNVVIYDQRGHGLSERVIDGLSLIHVESFYDYAKDLDCLIKKLVQPTCPELPIYLFSHSMGGAVVCLYLEQFPGDVSRAILSSPMLMPNCYGVPTTIVKARTKSLGQKYGWTAKFPYSNDFNPNVQVATSSDISPARFTHNLNYRIQNAIYQTSATTNRWMWEAMHLQEKILASKAISAIKCKLLLMNAGMDTSVKKHPQEQFAKRANDCIMHSFPTSKHTIYTASDDILQEYYELIFQFLG